MNFLAQTGFSQILEDPRVLVMILIAFVLMYLAIKKGFEPLLLLPIAFGMLLTNLPGAGLYHTEFFTGGHVHWDQFTAGNFGLIDYLYLGVKLGIFITYLGATLLMGFEPAQAASIGIIGGADGPTAIYVTTKLAPDLLGPIAVAAYSYMALVPVIQPPIMKALTTKKEREIVMKQLRPVSKTEKIIFPIVGMLLTCFVVPSGLPLLGMLFFGNLLRECGVTSRLAKTASNALTDIVTILLGMTVGASTQASQFLTPQTIFIFFLGFMAFVIASSSGVLFVKLFNLFLPKTKKINPLIGNAGVSAVPMSARISNNLGLEYDPSNYLLMHTMGPNVAGVIGSAVAAGVLLGFLA